MSKRAVNLLRNMAVPFKFNASNPLKGVNNDLIALAAARALLPSESGAIIYWTHSASNHDITLPAAKKGLNFKFVIAVGHAANHHIDAAGNDEIYGNVKVVSTTDDKTAVQVVARGAALDQIRLHSGTGVATVAGNGGDQINLVCVEDGYWLCSTVLTSLNAAPSGIAVIL
jgi:hypothetical protein